MSKMALMVIVGSIEMGGGISTEMMPMEDCQGYMRTFYHDKFAPLEKSKSGVFPRKLEYLTCIPWSPPINHEK